VNGVGSGGCELSRFDLRPGRRLAPVALGGFFAAVLCSAALEGGQYEQAPVFQASQVLPANLLRSPYYTVGNSVGLDNFQYVFKVKWGPFTVKGSDLMRVRAREMAATAELEKIDSAGTVVNAAGANRAQAARYRQGPCHRAP
jgi:hypothetical protein